MMPVILSMAVRMVLCMVVHMFVCLVVAVRAGVVFFVAHGLSTLESGWKVGGECLGSVVGVFRQKRFGRRKTADGMPHARSRRMKPCA